MNEVTDLVVIMMVCGFFGHKDAPDTLSILLYQVLVDLVDEGIDTFLVGNQGHFDSLVLSLLRQLKQEYPHIAYHIVLAYFPGPQEKNSLYLPTETLYPEGLELVHPRYAIAWRNKWMINESDIVVTYITHSWGGAAQYAAMAQRKKKRIINIASSMANEE